MTKFVIPGYRHVIYMAAAAMHSNPELTAQQAFNKAKASYEAPTYEGVWLTMKGREITIDATLANQLSQLPMSLSGSLTHGSVAGHTGDRLSILKAEFQTLQYTQEALAAVIAYFPNPYSSSNVQYELPSGAAAKARSVDEHDAFGTISWDMWRTDTGLTDYADKAGIQGVAKAKGFQVGQYWVSNFDSLHKILRVSPTKVITQAGEFTHFGNNVRPNNVQLVRQCREDELPSHRLIHTGRYYHSRSDSSKYLFTEPHGHEWMFRDARTDFLAGVKGNIRNESGKLGDPLPYKVHNLCLDLDGVISRIVKANDDGTVTDSLNRTFRADDGTSTGSHPSLWQVIGEDPQGLCAIQAIGEIWEMRCGRATTIVRPTYSSPYLFQCDDDSVTVEGKASDFGSMRATDLIRRIGIVQDCDEPFSEAKAGETYVDGKGTNHILSKCDNPGPYPLQAGNASFTADGKFLLSASTQLDLTRRIRKIVEAQTP